MKPTLLISLLTLLAACSPSAQEESRSSPKYQIVGSQGIIFFVVMPPDSAKDQEAFRAAAKTICEGRSHCQVTFWLDASQAARSLPMTDSQVNAIHAVYNINTSTGLDGFTCHPFGTPGDQCADI